MRLHYLSHKLDQYLSPIIQHLPHERVEDFHSADFILHPKVLFGENDYESVTHQIKTICTAPIPTIIFIVTDITIPFFQIDNAIIFTTSLEASRRSPSEIILPFIWAKTHQNNQFLPKTEKPKVGFCGQMWNVYRIYLVKALQNRPDIQCQFIIRTQFAGGDPNSITLQNDFIQNMDQSHFVVCSRGAGNWSMRFYETLAHGRIPVLIDSDMVLPFSDEIDWSEHIVMGKTAEETVERLLAFYHEKDIEEAQKKCKSIYYKYFTPNAFANKIPELVRSASIKKWKHIVSLNLFHFNFHDENLLEIIKRNFLFSIKNQTNKDFSIIVFYNHGFSIEKMQEIGLLFNAYHQDIFWIPLQDDLYLLHTFQQTLKEMAQSNDFSHFMVTQALPNAFLAPHFMAAIKKVATYHPDYLITPTCGYIFEPQHPIFKSYQHWASPLYTSVFEAQKPTTALVGNYLSICADKKTYPLSEPLWMIENPDSTFSGQIASPFIWRPFLHTWKIKRLNIKSFITGMRFLIKFHARRLRKVIQSQ